MNQTKIKYFVLCMLLGLTLGTKLHAQVDYYDNFTDNEVKSPTEEELIARGESLKAYTIKPNTGDLMRAPVDSAMLGFYSRVKAEGRSLALGYLGNLHSPWESKLFFDRPVYLPKFFYAYAMQGLGYDPQTALYYDTKTPMTQVFYQRFGDIDNREEQIKGSLGLNLGKQIGLGGDVDYAYAKGFYMSNSTKVVNYRLYGYYRTDRYEAYASIANNYHRLMENGGIKDDTYITHPQNHDAGKKIVSKDIPVRFPGANLFNTIRSGHADLTHRYNLGFYQNRSLPAEVEGGEPRDTTVFVPVSSVTHMLSFTKNRRRFIGKSKSIANEYPEHYIFIPDGDSLITIPNDTTRMQVISNTLSLSLREGFHKWAKFGLAAFVRLENVFYTQQDSVAGVSPTDRENTTYIGATLSRSQGRLFNFLAEGELAVLGADAGAFDINGRAIGSFTIWRQKSRLEAWGQLTNKRPSYFMRHHHGSFHWWDENLKFMQQLRLGASLTLPVFGAELRAQTATLNNFFYLGADAKPVQASDPIQVMELRAKHQYALGILGWQAELAYQTSTNATALPLPKLAGFAALYLDFRLPKKNKVMRVQLGLDARMHSSYRAPYYEPALMQFVNQENVKIGGSYPLINAFANIHLKRSRFFIEMYNIAESFMDSKRFSLAHYPYNPMVLRMGIGVDFNK